VLQERAWIARELHDTVSQTLYAITLGAVRARSLLELNEGIQVQRIIDDVLQLAGAGQTELRAILTDIRSDRLASRTRGRGAAWTFACRSQASHTCQARPKKHS